jgi:hypothetical protein
VCLFVGRVSCGRVWSLSVILKWLARACRHAGDCVACTAVSGGCEKIQRSAKCFACALVCSVVILLCVLPCVPVYESALSQERLVRNSIEWIGYSEKVKEKYMVPDTYNTNI